MKECWAYQPEARPSMSSLACSLLSMYNVALPGEYLELILPTLPTPTSSAKNSSHQFVPTPHIMPSQFIPNEYLTPNHVTIPSNHSPGSPPNNHRPAANTHSDLTTHAGYQNRLGTNVRWDMDKRRCLFSKEDSVISSDSSEDNLIEMCEMLPLEKNLRSDGDTSKLYVSHRGSSESGYGTRSSVFSEKDRLCHYNK